MGHLTLQLITGWSVFCCQISLNPSRKAHQLILYFNFQQWIRVTADSAGLRDRQAYEG